MRHSFLLSLCLQYVVGPPSNARVKLPPSVKDPGDGQLGPDEAVGPDLTVDPKVFQRTEEEEGTTEEDYEEDLETLVDMAIAAAEKSLLEFEEEAESTEEEEEIDTVVLADTSESTHSSRKTVFKPYTRRVDWTTPRPLLTILEPPYTLPPLEELVRTSSNKGGYGNLLSAQ
eukprot:Blabericola_migrator_1__5032@NODE_260_length_10712_cov_94_884922_g218_i0_p5_GENE_NODE_260_length_10712_cov_94_884922_g218_i0NODE_260_length_10712_cov_94_884922_g218_i0_p5_ORF_typecomplete_len172_score45_06LTV/PF04180_14/0_016Podoplanin/PF05808_11/0_12Myc_N/PF01056_18/6_9_NODE_260_length_10712_cov_94_884922_g218_i0973810253